MNILRNLGITILLGIEALFYTIVRLLSIPMEKREVKPRETPTEKEEDILGIWDYDCNSDTKYNNGIPLYRGGGLGNI